MRGFRVLIGGLILAFGLSGCATAVVTTASLLADNGDGDPVSGHQIGTQVPKAIFDFGDVRVRVADVVSTRNFPIPNSKVFRFSWTPKAYNASNAAKGLRAPTDADWGRRLQTYIDSAIRGGGPAVGPDANTTPLSEKRIRAVKRAVADERRQFDRSEFKPVVNAKGDITRCNDTYGGKFGCTVGFSASKADQIALARQALARTDPGCRIGQVDPPALQALRPGIKSGSLSVVASVVCS